MAFAGNQLIQENDTAMFVKMICYLNVFVDFHFFSRRNRNTISPNSPKCDFIRGRIVTIKR